MFIKQSQINVLLRYWPDCNEEEVRKSFAENPRIEAYKLKKPKGLRSDRQWDWRWEVTIAYSYFPAAKELKDDIENIQFQSSPSDGKAYSTEYLSEMWKEFGDVPINDDETIDEGFFWWAKGTDRFAIWDWFDRQHPHGVVGLQS